MLATVGGRYVEGRRQATVENTTTAPVLSTSGDPNLHCRGTQMSPVWFIVLQKVEYGVLGHTTRGVSLVIEARTATLGKFARRSTGRSRAGTLTQTAHGMDAFMNHLSWVNLQAYDLYSVVALKSDQLSDRQESSALDRDLSPRRDINKSLHVAINH